MFNRKEVYRSNAQEKYPGTDLVFSKMFKYLVVLINVSFQDIMDTLSNNQLSLP